MTSLIRKELCDNETSRFFDYLDDIFYRALVQYFQYWYDTMVPLVPDSVIEQLLQQFELVFPITALMYNTASNSSRKYKKKDNRNKLKKRYLLF